MKSFRAYLRDIISEYKFRIKTVIPFNEKQLSQIKDFLRKYDLISMEEPIKTIIQDHPLDFSGVNSAEVFILNCTLGMPASPHVLLNELSNYLRISQRFIVVRSEFDPLERETARYQHEKEIEDQIVKDGIEKISLLGTEASYPESELFGDGSEFYGNKYNTEFLKFLANTASENNIKNDKSKINFLKDLEKQETDISDSQDLVNFNSEIADSILSYPRWEVPKSTDEKKLKKKGKDKNETEGNEVHKTTGKWGQIDDVNHPQYKINRSDGSPNVIVKGKKQD